MDKTPISRLQEICAHNGLTPEYQLLSVEGRVHAPTFVFRVQVGEISATATGQSKKKAKHAVAKRAIELIIKDSDYIVENADIILEQLNHDLSESSEREKEENHGEEEDEDIDANPVGKLQEICMKKHWRPPAYETISEEGLPHERVFKMKCFVENMGFSETGTGKSKRLAKRKAAHLMIQRLKKEDLAECDDVSEKLHDKKDSVFDDWVESKKSGKVIPAMEKINNFYYGLNENINQEINEMVEKSIEANETDMGLDYDKDYLSLLADLTKSMDCSFRLLTVPQVSYTDRYQCMVHIIPNDISYSDLPVLTAWGSAEELEDAKQTAAGNAIKLFSLLKDKKLEDNAIEAEP